MASCPTMCHLRGSSVSRNVPAFCPEPMDVYRALICQCECTASLGSHITLGSECPANSIDHMLRLSAYDRDQTQSKRDRLPHLSSQDFQFYIRSSTLVLRLNAD